MLRYVYSSHDAFVCVCFQAWLQQCTEKEKEYQTAVTRDFGSAKFGLHSEKEQKSHL